MGEIPFADQRGLLQSLARYATTWADVLTRGPLATVNRRAQRRRGYQQPALFLTHSVVLAGAGSIGVIILQNASMLANAGYERLLPVQVALALGSLIPILFQHPIAMLVARALWPKHRVSPRTMWEACCYSTALLVLQPMLLLLWNNVFNVLGSQLRPDASFRYLPVALAMGVATPIWFLVAVASGHRRPVLKYATIAYLGLIVLNILPAFAAFAFEPSTRGDPQIILNTASHDGPLLQVSYSVDDAGDPEWAAAVQASPGDT